MPRQNSNKRSIFSRIKKTLGKAFDFIIRTEPKPKTSKKESVIKKATNRIRKAIAKIGSGTTVRVPTAKYSTGEVGWGRDKKTFVRNKQGVNIPINKYKELEDFVKKYNEQLEKKTQQLIDNARKIFPAIEVDNMEASMKRAIERDKRRFSNTLFEDLRTLDAKELADRIGENDNIEEFIKEILEKDYYDLDKRNKMYKENYKKALFNEWGETTETQKIADIIDELDTDTFMLSYYNEYSGVSILAVYEAAFLGDRGFLSKVKDYFTNLKEKQSDLTWN